MKVLWLVGLDLEMVRQLFIPLTFYGICNFLAALHHMLLNLPKVFEDTECMQFSLLNICPFFPVGRNGPGLHTVGIF